MKLTFHSLIGPLLSGVIATHTVSIRSASEPLPGRLFCKSGGIWGGINAFNPGSNGSFSLTPHTFVGDTVYFVDQRSNTSDATVSDDGRVMAVTSDRNQVAAFLFVFDGDGTNARQITFPYLGGNGDNAPVISPDGTRVAFISRRGTNVVYQGEIVRSPQLFMINADGSNLTQVTSGIDRVNASDFPRVQTYAADWSPDGRKLAYRGIRVVRSPGQDPYYSQVVGIIDLEAQTDTILFGTGSTGNSEGLDWSHSGKYIVAGHGGEAQSAPQPRILIYNTQTGLLSEDLRVGNPAQSYGGIRVAPDDSFYIVPLADSAFTAGYRLASLEAPSEVRSIPANFPPGPFYWQPGPNWPRPARLVAQPAYLEIPRGFNATNVVNAVLYGADGRVISRRAGLWNDIESGSYTTQLSQWGDMRDDPNRFGGFSRFRAFNAGLTNDLIVQNGKARVILDNPRVYDEGIDWRISVRCRNTGDAQIGAGGFYYPSATLSGVPMNNPGYRLATSPGESGNVLFWIAKGLTSSGPKTMSLRGAYPGGSYSTSLRVTIP